MDDVPPTPGRLAVRSVDQVVFSWTGACESRSAALLGEIAERHDVRATGCGGGLVQAREIIDFTY
ncbi:hypothetical protein [Actinomadura sp. HBU206391]|uniref:hypothetical protein n=1 Tax=Actinomadura sp. HBU206391 TaxID=2731692 RepID=UPI001650D086|nr:hypothetical protein [Actinomadura sp. HBU206391]MBC6461298.1 hypothetical protein [Actinomadura sp. HBU206391]